MRTPTVIWPTRLRSSPISSSILMATAVEETATTKPSRTIWAVVQSSTEPMAHMTASAATIWVSVVKTAIFQTSRMPRRDSSMPIRNSSMRTPSSASTWMKARFSTSPRPEGPRMTPATI